MRSVALGLYRGSPCRRDLCDLIGRRWRLVVSALPLLAASVGTPMSEDRLTFNAFRILGRVDVGLASIVAPMYFSEIVPPRLRDRLVSQNRLAIVFGLVAAVMVLYVLSFHGAGEMNVRLEMRPYARLTGLLTILPERLFKSVLRFVI